MPEKDKKAYSGFKGTIRAALTKHPDKFSKKACDMSPSKRKKSGKLCPYAIFTAQKEKGDKAHYKELPSTLKGKPVKKEKYKKEDKKKKMDEYLNSPFPEKTGMPGKPGKKGKKKMKTFKEFLEEKGFKLEE